MIVNRNESFQVADHVFTKFCLIPSVTLRENIPEDITDSWYTDRVFIGLKGGSFQPSSLHRHITELHEVLMEHNCSSINLSYLCIVMVVLTSITYLSLKLSLSALFLKDDLD